MDLVEVKEHKIEVVVNLNLVGTFPKVNGETKDQLTPNQDKSQNSCGSYGHLQAEYQHRFEPYYEVQDFEPKDEQVQREEVEPEEVYTAFNRFEVFAAAPGTIVKLFHFHIVNTFLFSFSKFLNTKNIK